MGILTAAVGVVMIIYPVATAAASTVFFGWALIIAAVAQLVFAFSAPTAGKFVLTLLLGVLYGIAGLSLVAAPGLGVVTLTAVLGAMLIGEAVVETVMAFSLPAGAGRGGFLLNALVQPAARRDDPRAVADQLDLGDRDDRRCGRALQRSHACGDLGQYPP